MMNQLFNLHDVTGCDGMNSLGPYLPSELERLIFELALFENGAKNSTPLRLVAQRVNSWISPLIFRVMNQLQSYHGTVPSFIRFPQLLSSVGHFVQHLLIGGGSFSSLGTILSSCPNVRNLAIWACPASGLLPTLQQMHHLTRLSASLSGVHYFEFLILPFSNLTHLEILALSSAVWTGQLEALTNLPKLTHIGVCCNIEVNVVSKLLLLCPLLKLLVMMPDSPHSYRDLDPLQVADNRLVLLVWLDNTLLIHDWEMGANGGVDVWTFSELIVIARGRKYFLRPLPKWISRFFYWEEYLNVDGRKWFSELN